MGKSLLGPCEALYPVHVVLVCCLDRSNSRANAITIAWCGVAASNPPQICISVRPSRHSHRLIEEEREFSVNVPSSKILKGTDICGILSGKDGDKLKRACLTASPASKISAPILNECPVNIECRLRHKVNLGSHDLFVGEVVEVHADDGLLDRNGRIDYAKAGPFVFNQGEYWDLGKKIGHYGFSQK